jgi:hypothetical protein
MLLRNIIRWLSTASVCLLALTVVAQDAAVAQASVDTVNVIYNTVSNLAPVQVEVEGTLADACTRVTDVSQTHEQAELTLTIATTRSTDALCSRALEPFAATYDLVIADLKAGDYRLTVNGVSASVTITEAMLRAARSEEAASIPPQCRKADGINTAQYYQPDVNFCFIYPANAIITEADNMVSIDFFGNGGVPTTFTIAYAPVDEQSLDDLAEAYLADHNDAVLHEGVIGIYPARIATTLTEDESGLTALFIAGDTAFTLVDTPADPVLWGMVTQTFFIPTIQLLPTETTSLEDLPETCPQPTEEANVYYSETGYYCLLLPMGYVTRVQDTAVLITTQDADGDGVVPFLAIAVFPAFGQTLDEVTETVKAQNSQLEFETDTLKIAGEPAYVSEGLPTATGSTLVLTLIDDWVIQFVLTPADSRYPDETEQAEALWQTTLDSFTALPRPEQDTTPQVQVLMNAALGYGFMYPSNFEITELESGSIILQGPTNAALEDQRRFTIAVLPTEGRTLDEFLEEVQRQNASVVLKFEETEVAGQRFVYTDNLPAPLPSRQGFMLWDDKILLFDMVPYDEALWEQFVGTFEPLQIEQDDGN